MGADWALVAPDWASRDQVWKNPLPFVLWPVCGKPVLAYWLDEAVRLEAASITIFARDRPHLIRAWLDRGEYWSKKIGVIPSDPPPGAVVHTMSGLPGSEEAQLPEELVARWAALHRRALTVRESGALLIDREISPGVWAGPGAAIDSTAVLQAPCWIGPRARVGARCRLGPNVFVARRAVLDDDVEAEDAVVCEDTYIGRHTQLEMCAAQGGLLLNWKLGTAVNILDDFILADLGPGTLRPSPAERLLALLLWAPCVVAAALWNLRAGPARESLVRLPHGPVTLRTRSAGPLILRRASWLGEIVRGRLRFIGILPRSDAAWSTLPPETRSLLERSPAGLLSLADLHGCHHPSEPDEWMHAAYQAGAPDGEGRRQALRAATSIALKTPLSNHETEV